MSRASLVAIMLCALTGCAYLPSSTEQGASGQGRTPAYADTIWITTKAADVGAGHIRVFLSDGSLLAATPEGRPAIGRWQTAPGGLAITLGGRTRVVRVLASDRSRMHLRRPGSDDGGDLVMVPAAHPLWGTSWRLAARSGKEIVDGPAPTLAFPAPGRVAGKGGCNRYSGPVTLGESTIELAHLVSTRMACPGPVGEWESRYFKTLRAVEGFTLDGEKLTLWNDDGDARLRFERVAGANALRASHDEARGRVNVYSPGPRGTPFWFRAVAREDSATLYLPARYCDRPVSLPRKGSASGAKYAGDGMLFWTAGERVRLAIDGRAMSRCTHMAAENESAFRAVGQEPGWHLSIHPGEHIRFVHDYGEGEVLASVSEPERHDERVIYHAVTDATTLRVEIMDEPCRDVMSGERFASTVQVRYKGETFKGCGGTPP